MANELVLWGKAAFQRRQRAHHLKGGGGRIEPAHGVVDIAGVLSVDHLGRRVERIESRPGGQDRHPAGLNIHNDDGAFSTP